MKHLSGILLLGLATTAFGNELFSKQFVDGVKVAKTECCSGHGNICGCIQNYARCCDGVLVPACGYCFFVDPDEDEAPKK